MKETPNVNRYGLLYAGNKITEMLADNVITGIFLRKNCY